MIAILVIGVTFSIGLFVMLGRYAAEVPGDDSTLGTQVDALTSIGRYTLVDRIGQGGMAEIYSAVTTGEGTFRRPVVIKRLRPELTVDPTAVAQFCDEANLLAALHHPNIVSVHDFGRAQNQYFLAEEYVPGRDLGRLISRRFARAQRPLPIEVIAYVGAELLKGLEYAHTPVQRAGPAAGASCIATSRPENMMISTQGEVKLLDFGVVKAAEGRVAQDRDGRGQGQRHLHVPRTGARPGGRCAGGPVFDRPGALHLLYGTPPVRGRHDLRAADEGRGRARGRGAGRRSGIFRNRSATSSIARPPIGSRIATAGRPTMMADLEPFAQGRLERGGGAGHRAVRRRDQGRGAPPGCVHARDQHPDGRWRIQLMPPAAMR